MTNWYFNLQNIFVIKASYKYMRISLACRSSISLEERFSSRAKISNSLHRYITKLRFSGERIFLDKKTFEYYTYLEN